MRTIGAGLVALAAVSLAACKPAAPPLKAYAYPAWAFRASFPAPPVETPMPASADGSQPNADLVEATSNGRDFAVWAGDVSRANMSLNELADSASDHVAQGLGAKAGIPAYAATADRVDGFEYHLTKDGKWLVTMDVFLAGGRLYEVIAKSTLGQDDPAVKDFLISFHTLGGAPEASNAAPVTNAVANALAAPP
jgi:hypothetical protein